MKIRLLVIAFALAPGLASGQSQRPTIGSEVGGRLGTAEREVLQVAEAMPEEKYGLRRRTANSKAYAPSRNN